MHVFRMITKGTEGEEGKRQKSQKMHIFRNRDKKQRAKEMKKSRLRGLDISRMTTKATE